MASDFYRISETPDATVIELALPTVLDISQFDDLNQSILELLDKRKSGKWILDLTESSYMGSAVLGLMVNIRQHIMQGKGRLILCCMSERLAEIFRTCSLERLFVIQKSRADAVRALSAL